MNNKTTKKKNNGKKKTASTANGKSVSVNRQPPPKLPSLFILFVGKAGFSWYHITLDKEKDLKEKSEDSGNKDLHEKDGKDNSSIRVNLPYLSPNYTDFLAKSGFGIAACGSKIYSFGGWERDSYQERGKNVIWVFDASLAEPKWEMLSSVMPQPRYFPFVVPFNSKFYVFGSNLYSTRIPQPWAEVFTPCSGGGTWESIREPPEYFIKEMCIMGAAVFRDEIFLEVGRRVYSFHPDLQTWDDVTTDYPDFPPLFKLSPVVNDVLYTVGCGELIAYDLLERKTCRFKGSKVVMDLLGSAHIKGVYHLGNARLCIVWNSLRRDSQPPIHYLHYATFEVELLKSVKHMVRAYNLFSEQYIVDGISICDSVAL